MRLCKLIAKGRVQGVNYRYFVCQQARTLGVNGQVRNLPDGTVEIIVEAENRSVLEEFKTYIRHRAHEPFGLKVVELITKSEEEVKAPAYTSFEIAH